MKYKMLSGWGPDNITETVNLYLKKGWKLHGSGYSEAPGQHYQPMIKGEYKE